MAIGRWREDAPRPLFFLSYAHSSRRVRQRPGDGSPQPWEEVLFEDLCDAVADLAGLRNGEPSGFMDRGMRVGEDWSTRISEAVAHTEVFVPLYAPLYFRSEPCGQEWAAFAERRVLPVTRVNGHATGIVPVKWVDVHQERMPKAAAGLQFAEPDLGPEYSQLGLLALAKMIRFRAEYEYAVHLLAQRIVDVSEQTIIPVGECRDFQEYPSAFGTPVPRRQLHIWVAACHLGRLPEGRSADGYGPEPQDWRPFGGGATSTASSRAEQVAREMQRLPVIRDFATEARELLDGGGPKAPVLLLLDRWLLLDPAHRELLARIDALKPSWVSLLQPWNREDPECADREQELLALAARTMPHFHSRRPGRDSGVLDSLATYEEALQGAVHTAVRGYEQPGGEPAPAASAPGEPPPAGGGEPRRRIRGPRPDGPPGGSDGAAAAVEDGAQQGRSEGAGPEHADDRTSGTPDQGETQHD